MVNTLKMLAVIFFCQGASAFYYHDFFIGQVICILIMAGFAINILENMNG